MLGKMVMIGMNLKKKFKVRISHFKHEYYTIDYTEHYLFPSWKSLYFWFDQTLTSGTECWSLNLFTVKEAEDLVSKINNMNDIDQYYKIETEKMNKFKAKQREYYEKNVPYKNKLMEK